MPRGPSPQWKRLKEPVLDHLIHASVNQAAGKHDENGHYAELHYVGCDTRERAEEIKKGLYRAAKRQGYSLSGCRILRHENGWKVVFRAGDKTAAKAYIIARYGPDRSKWPYDPRRKNNT